MRYLFVAGERRYNAMHIERFTVLGDGTMEAMCEIAKPFNRSINAPFALGKRICKKCARAAEKTRP
jgi:hypothetical protein